MCVCVCVCVYVCVCVFGADVSEFQGQPFVQQLSWWQPRRSEHEHTCIRARLEGLRFATGASTVGTFCEKSSPIHKPGWAILIDS